MRTARRLLVVLLAGCFVSCGVYEQAPEFSGRRVGDGCGPCGLGVFEGDGCDLRALEGVLEQGGSCDSVVFAAANSAEGDGSFARPFGSLERAGVVGLERGARVIVVLGGGVFEEEVSIADGVSLFGGYDEDGVLDWIV